MLKGVDFPKELRVEAVSATAYLLNRFPTKKLKNITPKESWFGFKPNMSHLKVFGSITYIHVPDQLRKKIDDKGEQMILVGYHSTGGYKLYDTVNKRIVIIRDVIFDELKD